MRPTLKKALERMKRIDTKHGGRLDEWIPTLRQPYVNRNDLKRKWNFPSRVQSKSRQSRESPGSLFVLVYNSSNNETHTLGLERLGAEILGE